MREGEGVPQLVSDPHTNKSSLHFASFLQDKQFSCFLVPGEHLPRHMIDSEESASPVGASASSLWTPRRHTPGWPGSLLHITVLLPGKLGGKRQR